MDAPKSLRSQTLEYATALDNADGVLADLPDKLENTIHFDNLRLDGLPTSKRLTLWFRNGAKKIFHVSMVRRGGRLLVEMGGLEKGDVLRCIGICKVHFDRWFGITHQDVAAFERKRAELRTKDSGSDRTEETT